MNLDNRASLVKTVLHRVYSACAILAGICLILILALVTLQILARALGFLAPGVDDFAVYALAGCAFLALPYAFKEGAHIRVNFVLRRITSPKRRYAAEVAGLGLMALLCGFFAWSSVMFIWTSYQFNDLATTYFATPLWIPRLVLALGTIVLFVAVVEELVDVIRGRTPSYQTAGSREI